MIYSYTLDSALRRPLKRPEKDVAWHTVSPWRSTNTQECPQAAVEAPQTKISQAWNLREDDSRPAAEMHKHLFLIFVILGNRGNRALIKE